MIPTSLSAELPLVLLLLLITSRSNMGQTPPLDSSASEQSTTKLSASGLSGTLILSGSPIISEAAVQFLQRSLGNREPRVLVVQSRSDYSQITIEHVKKILRKASIQEIALSQPANSKENEFAEISELVREIAAADAVCISASELQSMPFLIQEPARQSPKAQAPLAQAALVRDELQRLVERGGVLVMCGAMTSVVGSHLILEDDSKLPAGLNILRYTMITNYSMAGEPFSPLQRAIESRPGHLGIGIDQQSTVVIQGRNLIAVGAPVTLALAECSYRPAELIRLENSRADLIQLLRAAAARQVNCDPGQPQPLSQSQTAAAVKLESAAAVKLESAAAGGSLDLGVKSGALVIVGGGRIPEVIARRFIELAGGPKARLVYLPTAVPPSQIVRQPPPDFLQADQVDSIQVLTQTGSMQIGSEEFQTALAEATGVWFGGGRQWNFVDAYDKTGAVELFHKVLERGGVIGGSSAGATIQGEYLVRGHPLGNTLMMAEGYERGFAFLPGTAIDQHFAQRDRFADLESVIRKHRQLLGIGIDEGTALVVRGRSAEVIGDGAVHFLNTQLLEQSDSSHAKELYRTFPAGTNIDLNNLGKVQ